MASARSALRRSTVRSARNLSGLCWGNCSPPGAASAVCQADVRPHTEGGANDRGDATGERRRPRRPPRADAGVLRGGRICPQPRPRSRRVSPAPGSWAYGGRSAFVDDLFVRPALRNRGVGRALVEQARAICEELGVRAMHLEVARANGPAYAAVGGPSSRSSMYTWIERLY